MQENTSRVYFILLIKHFQASDISCDVKWPTYEAISHAVSLALNQRKGKYMVRISCKEDLICTHSENR